MARVAWIAVIAAAILAGDPKIAVAIGWLVIGAIGWFMLGMALLRVSAHLRRR
jgi:hypothetical protein